MVRKTTRGKSPAKRRSSSTRSKKSARPAARSPRKKTSRRRRKKPLSLGHIILILSGLALLVIGISWGIIHYTSKQVPPNASCHAKKREITTFIMGTLFQQGITKRQVTWKTHGAKTSFTLKTDRHTFHRITKILHTELSRKYRGIRLKKKGNRTFLVLCGKTVTHRLAFIPPSPPPTYPQGEEEAAKPEKHPLPPPVATKKRGKRVKVAIVIDDIGNDLSIARNLMGLPVPVTLSIFPYAPHAKEIAKEAEEKGHEILMHLPMEPEGYPGKGKDPGPGALYVKMAPEDIVRQLNEDLDQIPEVCGINNHMGSRFTCDRRGMEAVMDVLKERGKFFLDSRTSAKSVGFQVAKEKGIPTIKRDVFLDNSRDVKKIEEQLDHLIREARKRGYAVGIGHPHRATYLALKKALPEYQKEGIEFVYISSLVR